MNCEHWNLKKSHLRAAGFGLCEVTPKPFGMATGYAPAHACEFGRFVAAPEAAMERRRRALALPVGAKA